MIKQYLVTIFFITSLSASDTLSVSDTIPSDRSNCETFQQSSGDGLVPQELMGSQWGMDSTVSPPSLRKSRGIDLQRLERSQSTNTPRTSLLSGDSFSSDVDDYVVISPSMASLTRSKSATSPRSSKGNHSPGPLEDPETNDDDILSSPSMASLTRSKSATSPRSPKGNHSLGLLEDLESNEVGKLPEEFIKSAQPINVSSTEHDQYQLPLQENSKITTLNSWKRQEVGDSTRYMNYCFSTIKCEG